MRFIFSLEPNSLLLLRVHARNNCDQSIRRRRLYYGQTAQTSGQDDYAFHCSSQLLVLVQFANELRLQTFPSPLNLAHCLGPHESRYRNTGSSVQLDNRHEMAHALYRLHQPLHKLGKQGLESFQFAKLALREDQRHRRSSQVLGLQGRDRV